MLEQLKDVAKRFDSIAAQLNAPETYGDTALLARLMREQKELAPLMEAYHAYAQLLSDLDAAKELGLSASELSAIRDEIAAAEQEIKRLLLPKDADDARSVIMEIRAGTGGEEAALFAADLYRMYVLYAARCGFRVEVASASETELGGFKEIVFTVEGEGAYSRLKYEAGSHCVKRVPETESNGRIQTSTATVAVLPEVDEVDFALDMKDVKIDTFRASGAGGQKVNKTSSAIRVTHLPTGMVVECQDERSQYQNKDRALAILRSKLYEIARSERSSAVAAQRRTQVGTGQRSEKIRTYFFLRSQVVDQRLEGDARTFNLERILNGELEELVDRLTTAEQTEKLKAQNE